jgi:predicted PurR-regulated permease PerM
MDDAYEEHLFSVFRQFANNIVLGSLVTSAVQGAVASVGYLIAGADRVIFLGILTAVLSFVPMLGAAGVGVGVGAYVAITVSPGWGLFVVVWSLVVTGTVDNLLKPMLLRGGSDIHPLLIFLSVFGGLGWMGVPGLLVGPVIVAFFLALYTIYVHDYVGVPKQDGDAHSPAPPPADAPALSTAAPAPDAAPAPAAPAPTAPASPPDAPPTELPAPPPQAPVTAPGSSGDGK